MNDIEDDSAHPENPLSSTEVESMLSQGLTPIDLEPQQRAGILASVFERIHRHAALERRCTIIRRADAWQNFYANTRVKTLSSGAPHSCLIEIPQGTTLPRHRHYENEECVVIEGTLVLGDIRVRPGSYHLAPPGSLHNGITAESDALIYLGGTSIGNSVKILRDLVTAWLPSGNPPMRTIHLEEGLWCELGERTQHQYLAENNGVKSAFVRMGSQTRLPENFGADASEVLVIQGEALLGDTLMQAGDYRYAPGFTPASMPASMPNSASDSSPAEAPASLIYSQTGALLFVRGTSLNLPVHA